MQFDQWMSLGSVALVALINFSVLSFYMGKVSSKLQHLERQLNETKVELKEARDVRIKQIEQMAETTAQLTMICSKVDRIVEHYEKNSS